MTASRSTTFTFGIFLFTIGALLAITLVTLTTWASIEATFYGFSRLGNEPMSGLTCPPMLNATETGSFSISIRNPTDKPVNPVLRVDIGNAGPWRSFLTPLHIAPDETSVQSWDISAADRVLDRFVFVKAYTYASYPLPNTEGLCGIFIIDVPWASGATIYWAWFTFSLFLLVAGLWTSEPRVAPLTGKLNLAQARKTLAVLLAIGLYSSYAGLWPLSIGVLTISVLASVVMALVKFSQ